MSSLELGEVLGKMAGQTLVDFFSGFLIDVLPSPVLWGLGILLVAAAYLVWKRAPLSAVSHIVFLMVLALVTVIGGVFELMRAILYAVSGVVFFLGLWQFIGKR